MNENYQKSIAGSISYDVVNTENQDSLERVVLFKPCEFIYFRLLKSNSYTHSNPCTWVNLKQFFLLLIDYISLVVFKLNRKSKEKWDQVSLPVAQWNPITGNP